MPIKGNQSIRARDQLSKTQDRFSNNQNLTRTFNISLIFLQVHKLSFPDSQFSFYILYPIILLLQSFLASVFHFQSNFIMKFVIFQVSPYNFSINFQSSSIFQSIFY